MLNPFALALTATQLAQYLILKQYWTWQKSPWADAEFTAAELEQHWADLEDDLQDARNDVRHHGSYVPDIPTRIHYTWTRNFEAEVYVIHLDDGRGLAYNHVTGGGKHGEPDAYAWWKEAWFVQCTGTKTVTTHTYEDIPEVKSAPATE